MIDSEDEVRALLLSMVRTLLASSLSTLTPSQIESNDITAQISASGTVTFSDPPAQFTKEQVDSVLRDAQNQTALLAYLELEMGRSKEYLGKAVKTNDSTWAPNTEEEIFANLGGQHMWEDNIYS
jgi:COP9 signalosome complex subunit 3